ncbi:hypothetical protein VB713_01735 [Anabaena cylindrica UHCC 0172]|uniref:hypothetical protein n=1 Tax=Anabaena cylindrica TaxID=1165 RepID=UPI002B200F07|nr:hypothetical protein [Anabaena cylindrica]MEA5549711.1 hypothetical protein [Anabaena cylindrica UHCC 0172]
MPTLKTSQFTPVPILSLLVGGCLVLTYQYRPAQAEIPNNGFLIAQTESPFAEILLSQQSLPQLQQMEPVEFYQKNSNSQPSSTAQISQYGENFERYFVYVDGDNSQTLQRVRQIENSAYIRQYNGRNIIQAGVFSKPLNAQQRVRELELNGINGARIVNFSNTEAVSYYSGSKTSYSTSTNVNNASSSVQQKQSNFYYAIVPSSYNNLRYLKDQIQQRIGRNISVFMRTQPRGAHIAVGPFAERSEAEQWNNYLRNLGYGNTRVYYGK